MANTFNNCRKCCLVVALKVLCDRPVINTAILLPFPVLSFLPHLICLGLSHNSASPGEKFNPLSIPQHNVIPSLVKLNPLLTLGLCEVNEKAPSIPRQPSFFVEATLRRFPGVFPDPCSQVTTAISQLIAALGHQGLGAPGSLGDRGMAGISPHSRRRQGHGG